MTDLVIEEGVKGMTIDEDSKVNFEAKKALFNRSEKTLEMQEDVKIETDDGLRLESELIKWNQDKGEVFTDTQVKITKDNNIEIQGKGLDAQPSLKKVKIGEEVKVKIPQEDSFILINCEGPLEIDYQKGVAVFYNEVEVNQKDSQLFSDKATVYFAPEEHTLDRIVAEGNVRIIRGKDTSFSEKATFVASTKKVKLEGSPRLVIFPQEDQNFLE